MSRNASPFQINGNILLHLTPKISLEYLLIFQNQMCSANNIFTVKAEGEQTRGFEGSVQRTFSSAELILRGISLPVHTHNAVKPH